MSDQASKPSKRHRVYTSLQQYQVRIKTNSGVSKKKFQIKRDKQNKQQDTKSKISSTSKKTKSNYNKLPELKIKKFGSNKTMQKLIGLIKYTIQSADKAMEFIPLSQYVEASFQTRLYYSDRENLVNYLNELGEEDWEILAREQYMKDENCVGNRRKQRGIEKDDDSLNQAQNRRSSEHNKDTKIRNNDTKKSIKTKSKGKNNVNYEQQRRSIQNKNRETQNNINSQTYLRTEEQQSISIDHGLLYQSLQPQKTTSENKSIYNQNMFRSEQQLLQKSTNNNCRNNEMLIICDGFSSCGQLQSDDKNSTCTLVCCNRRYNQRCNYCRCCCFSDNKSVININNNKGYVKLQNYQPISTLKQLAQKEPIIDENTIKSDIMKLREQLQQLKELKKKGQQIGNNKNESQSIEENINKNNKDSGDNEILVQRNNRNKVVVRLTATDTARTNSKNIATIFTTTAQYNDISHRISQLQAQLSICRNNFHAFYSILKNVILRHSQIYQQIDLHLVQKLKQLKVQQSGIQQPMEILVKLVDKLAGLNKKFKIEIDNYNYKIRQDHSYNQQYSQKYVIKDGQNFIKKQNPVEYIDLGVKIDIRNQHRINIKHYQTTVQKGLNGMQLQFTQAYGKQIQRLKLIIEDKSKLIADLQEKLRRCQLSLQQQQHNNNQKQAQIVKLKQLILSQQQKLIINQHKINNENLNEQKLIELNCVIQNKQQQIGRIYEELQTRRKDISKLQQCVYKLQQSLHAQLEKNTSLKQMNEHLEREVQKLSAERVELIDVVCGLEEKERGYERLLGENEKEMETRQKELVRIENKLDEMEEENRMLLKRCQQQVGLRVYRQEQLKQRQRKWQQMMRQQQQQYGLKHSEQILRLKEQIERLEKENSKLNRGLYQLLAGDYKDNNIRVNDSVRLAKLAAERRQEPQSSKQHQQQHVCQQTYYRYMNSKYEQEMRYKQCEHHQQNIEAVNKNVNDGNGHLELQQQIVLLQKQVSQLQQQLSSYQLKHDPDTLSNHNNDNGNLVLKTIKTNINKIKNSNNSQSLSSLSEPEQQLSERQNQHERLFILIDTNQTVQQTPCIFNIGLNQNNQNKQEQYKLDSDRDYNYRVRPSILSNELKELNQVSPKIQVYRDHTVTLSLIDNLQSKVNAQRLSTLEKVQQRQQVVEQLLVESRERRQLEEEQNLTEQKRDLKEQLGNNDQSNRRNNELLGADRHLQRVEMSQVRRVSYVTGSGVDELSNKQIHGEIDLHLNKHNGIQTVQMTLQQYEQLMEKQRILNQLLRGLEQQCERLKEQRTINVQKIEQLNGYVREQLQVANQQLYQKDQLTLEFRQHAQQLKQQVSTLQRINRKQQQIIATNTHTINIHEQTQRQYQHNQKQLSQQIQALTCANDALRQQIEKHRQFQLQQMNYKQTIQQLEQTVEKHKQRIQQITGQSMLKSKQLQSQYIQLDTMQREFNKLKNQLLLTKEQQKQLTISEVKAKKQLSERDRIIQELRHKIVQLMQLVRQKEQQVVNLNRKYQSNNNNNNNDRTALKQMSILDNMLNRHKHQIKQQYINLRENKRLVDQLRLCQQKQKAQQLHMDNKRYLCHTQTQSHNQNQLQLQQHHTKIEISNNSINKNSQKNNNIVNQIPLSVVQISESVSDQNHNNQNNNNKKNNDSSNRLGRSSSGGNLNQFYLENIVPQFFGKKKRTAYQSQQKQSYKQ